MRIGIGIILFIIGAQSTVAQKQLVSTVDFEDALVYYRPRIALAEDGGFAVSWEVLRKLANDEEWQVGLSRFTADGEEIGYSQYLTQATFCGYEEGSLESGIRNVDMGFSSDGLLVVSMEQFRLSLESETQETQQLSSVKVSVLDQQGEAFQRASDIACDWAETDHIFAKNSSLPRLDLDPYEDVLLSTDGHSLSMAPSFNTEKVSRGAVPSGKAADRLIPAMSRSGNQTNSWVDVATNGWFNASSWQSCTEGLFSQADMTCDVEIQFFSELEQEGTDEITRRFVVNQDENENALNYRPAVAMNAAGNSIVVWIDYRESDYGDIYGQRFDEFGQPVDGNFKISNGNGVIDCEDGSRPEVALLDDGRFLVVWTEHHADGMRAWGRYYESSGLARAEPFLLDPDPTLESGFPDVAANSEDFAFTWLVEQDGISSVFVNIPGVTLSPKRSFPLADETLSLKGYPNPFTAETTLEYSLQQSGHVTLVIFDLLGREVKTLIDQPQGPGSYHVRLDANELATGYYVTRLQQGNQRQSRLLVRTE